MELDIQMLEFLKEKGIQFTISNDIANFEDDYISLKPQEVQSFVADPEEFFANRYKVTREQLKEWLELRRYGDFVQCSATTRKGERCKQIIPDRKRLTIERWLELQGQYCPVHSEGSAGTRGVTLKSA